MFTKIFVHNYNRDNTVAYVTLKYKDANHELKTLCKGRYNFDYDYFHIADERKSLLSLNKIQILVETLYEKDWGRRGIFYPRGKNVHKFKSLLGTVLHNFFK